MDDPASKEPLRVGEPVSGGESGNLPHVLFSLSAFSTLVIHPHLSVSSSPSRAVRFFPPAEDVPAQAPIQPIVGPRLITTLPNVRPSYRGRVRHGGPRAPTNSRDIPASERASERAIEPSRRSGNPRGDIYAPARVPCIHPSPARCTPLSRFSVSIPQSTISIFFSEPPGTEQATVSIQSEREGIRTILKSFGKLLSNWRQSARKSVHRGIGRPSARSREITRGSNWI